MKKYLYPLIVIFAIVIGVGAGTVYNIETSKGDIQNKAQSQIYTIDKYNTADTLYNFGSTPIGKFKDVFLEVQCLSDSSRTILVQTISKISPDTCINVNMIDVSAGTATGTAVTGAQTLTTGLRKIYKIFGNYDNFVITGEGRTTTKYRFWATGEQ